MWAGGGGGGGVTTPYIKKAKVQCKKVYNPGGLYTFLHYTFAFFYVWRKKSVVNPRPHLLVYLTGRTGI